MTAMKRLTMKQELFVQNYLVDLNATRAAVRAGYSEKTARKIGSENLSKPVICAAIQSAASERIERTKIDADYVLQGAREMFERCMQRVPVLDGEGNETGEWKFDSSGAGKALKLLGDHVQVNAFKSAGENDVPVVPTNTAWTVKVVHMTKADFDESQGNAKPPIEYRP
jgi:phage terminase small subunit